MSEPAVSDARQSLIRRSWLHRAPPPRRRRRAHRLSHPCASPYTPPSTPATRTHQCTAGTMHIHVYLVCCARRRHASDQRRRRCSTKDAKSDKAGAEKQIRDRGKNDGAERRHLVPVVTPCQQSSTGTNDDTTHRTQLSPPATTHESASKQSAHACYVPGGACDIAGGTSGITAPGPNTGACSGFDATGMPYTACGCCG